MFLYYNKITKKNNKKIITNIILSIYSNKTKKLKFIYIWKANTMLVVVAKELAKNPCVKLEKIHDVLTQVKQKHLSSEQRLAITDLLVQTKERLTGAEMTYMAGAPPAPEIVEEDSQKWKNFSTLLNEFPIVRITIRNGSIAYVQFACLDTRNTWSLFHDHFLLDNSPPHSSPQYPAGQWVLYNMQNHIEDPSILLNYVPVEYAGIEILVFVEERAN